MLELDAVTFAHPGQETPYRFDLTIPRGTITAVTGVSGSGKSTLLDLVAGFLAPASGRIRFAETDLTPLPPEQRPASILFQSDNLFDHLTVNANLELGLDRETPAATRRDRMAGALADVGLENMDKRRVTSLSGGQKQRVALARTLLRDRPVLLLDEPFSGLDAETAGTMRDMVRTMSRAHEWCTILVSHDMDDVGALADAHYEITDGRLSAREVQ